MDPLNNNNNTPNPPQTNGFPPAPPQPPVNPVSGGVTANPVPAMDIQPSAPVDSTFGQASTFASPAADLSAAAPMPTFPPAPGVSDIPVAPVSLSVDQTPSQPMPQDNPVPTWPQPSTPDLGGRTSFSMPQAPLSVPMPESAPAFTTGTGGTGELSQMGLGSTAMPNAASVPTPMGGEAAVDNTPGGPPSWMSSSNGTAEKVHAAPSLSESAPTDLSHLMDTASSGQVPAAGAAAPVVAGQMETLTVPAPASDANQVVTSSGAKGFPKWLLIVLGLFLLLIIGGASAYFILGIGQEKLPESIPAEQQTLSAPPKSIIPTTPPPATSSGSNSFGSLAGQSTPSAMPTKVATSSGQSGPSAIDLLRQRGQQ